MIRFLLALLLLVGLSAVAEARGFRRFVNRSGSNQGPAVRMDAPSDLQQIAMMSAQDRASRGNTGHSHFDRGHMVGVGFSTSDPTPATCFNNLPGAYSVVHVPGVGYYATKVIR